jgi:hypothetical protein
VQQTSWEAFTDPNDTIPKDKKKNCQLNEFV